MLNYWTSKAGNKEDGDIKEIARKKLDSDIESYWKNKKDEPEKKEKAE